MVISIFAATYNLFSQASSTDARRFNRWAFFMSIRQVIDYFNNLLSAAYLRWYLYIRISITRLAIDCTLAVKRAAVFFALDLTYNLIMAKKTTTELLTVQITLAQMRLLDYVSHLDAYDRVKDLNNIIYNAVGSDTTNDESMRQMLLLSDAMLDIAFENKA